MSGPRRATVLLCLCLLAPVPALRAEAPPEPISLSSYTALALASSPEVRQAEDNYKALEAAYKRAVADMALPTAAFNATAYPYGDNPDNGYLFNTWRLNRNDISVNSTLNWNLFNSFQDERRVQAARAARDAALKAWDAARQDRAYAAIEAYLQLDARGQVAEAVRQSAADQKAQFERSRELYKTGLRGEADLLKSETDWRSAELQLVAAESDRGAALIDFNTLIRRPQLEPALLRLDLSTAALKLPDVAVDIPRAVQRRPEVQRAQKLVEQARVQLRQAVQGILPSFRVDATWNHTETANFGTPVDAAALGIPNPNYYLGVSLALPLGFNGVSQAYAVVQARADRRAAEDALDQAALSARREVAQAYTELDRALRTFELAEQKQEIARRALDLVTRQYERGAADAIRMNQAQTDFLDARVARARAAHDIFINRARYRRAVGDPLWTSTPPP